MPDINNKNTTWLRFSCLSFVLFSYASSSGCISIRNTSSPCEVSNCNLREQANFASNDCVELYDRGEAVKRWVHKLNPVRVVPHGVVDWMSYQHAKCLSTKDSIQSWCAMKKEEANAPPWPRFHPVPTKPVFEPEPASNQVAPQVYGQFGKN